MFLHSFLPLINISYCLHEVTYLLSVQHKDPCKTISVQCVFVSVVRLVLVLE